jgi:hypothetical protein
VGTDIGGEASNDYFGVSVAISADGTRVAVGAFRNDGAGADDAGHTRVFEQNNGAWTQLGADIDGEAANDRSGYSVSLSADGNLVAVGAYENDGAGANAGHVRVFAWDNGAWTQLGADLDGESTYDYSGVSLSLSANGTRVAVGATGNDGAGSDAGHTRVFEWNNEAWTQLGADIDGEAASDYAP